jgi:hypothetical protein
VLCFINDGVVKKNDVLYTLGVRSGFKHRDCCEADRNVNDLEGKNSKIEHHRRSQEKTKGHKTEDREGPDNTLYGAGKQ